MRVSPNHVWYSRPPAKLHNRSIIPPHARQTSRLRLTAYRVDDNAIQLIVIGFFTHTGYFHACLPGDEGDKFPPHAHQTSRLRLAAYRVNDNAIRLIVIGFFAHTRYFHTCLPGDERDEFPPHAHQTSHLQLTAYRADDNAIRLIIIGFVAHTGYFHACLPGDEGDEFPPHAHQTSHLRLTAYHVDDNAIRLIIIRFVAHTGYFHTCLPGDEGDKFPPHAHQTSHLRLTAYRVDDNADSSLLDSSPTPGTSTPVSKGTRGTSFLHTLTKHHASDSLLIVSMIMLTHHHRILCPHQVLPHLSPRGRGGWVLHTLQLTAYHAVIGFFAHTGNFHTCLQGDEGDEFLVSPEKVLFLLSKSAISP